MQSVKTIKDLKGKRVLVRVDFNVPIKAKKVLDDSRLKASLPTIKFLIKKKAKIILVTHVGRPGGVVKPALKVDPIAEHLGKLLKRQVKKIETGNFKFTETKKLKLQKEIAKLRDGQIAMLDNIRFSVDEKKNTGTLAVDLAELADIFVLDGFAVAHRASASVFGVARFLPSYAGLLLQDEIKGLNKVLQKPKKPFIAVIGGAKTETKIPVIKSLISKADHILIGGGIVNTYLFAKGYGVCDSLVDHKFADEALKYCKKKKVIKPVDLVVGDQEGKNFHVVEIKPKPHQICKKGQMILDIGPATIRLFEEYIGKAKTVVWNGAPGYFEQEPYHIGTMAIARVVAKSSKGKAYGVIGGGETLQSMDMVGMSKYIDLVSTGGGAMLEFLAGNRLPGIEALG